MQTQSYDNDLLLRPETKKWLYVLEADIITIEKHWFNVSISKDAFFNGCIPSDCHCACLSNKSLLYQ